MYITCPLQNFEIFQSIQKIYFGISLVIKKNLVAAALVVLEIYNDKINWREKDIWEIIVRWSYENLAF